MRFFPVGGYAPGNYMNTCSTCRVTMFSVDKRANQCVTCAFGGTTPVFMFGSNLSGRHGSGAAAFALVNRGAVEGKAAGFHGNSFAIPTKDGNMRPLPLTSIEKHVWAFLQYAWAHPELQFQVTAVGCGRAGYQPSEIAPLFIDVPDNCVMPLEFRGLIG